MANGRPQFYFNTMWPYTHFGPLFLLSMKCEGATKTLYYSGLVKDSGSIMTCGLSESCKDWGKCSSLTSFAQQYILSAQGYFWNHHPFKESYWKKLLLFFSLAETLECYVALISSEMLLLWMKTKAKPFGYLFGIHCRDCMLTPPWCFLATAEMLSRRNHGSNGGEPYKNQ